MLFARTERVKTDKTVKDSVKNGNQIKSRRTKTNQEVALMVVSTVLLGTLALNSCNLKPVGNDDTDNESYTGEPASISNEEPDNIRYVFPTPDKNAESGQESNVNSGKNDETGTSEDETPLDTEKLPDEKNRALSYVGNGDGTCTVCGIGNVADSFVVIPDESPNGMKVSAIAPMAFYGNNNIVTVQIPKTVKEIGPMAFGNCRKLAYIFVSSENPAFCDIEGVLFDYNRTELICYPDAKATSRYELPSTIWKIRAMALYNCPDLQTIIFHGTKDDWEKVIKDEKNYALYTASMSFVSVSYNEDENLNPEK